MCVCVTVCVHVCVSLCMNMYNTKEKLETLSVCAKCNFSSPAYSEITHRRQKLVSLYYACTLDTYLPRMQPVALDLCTDMHIVLATKLC